jgi:hypothetical protein
VNNNNIDMKITTKEHDNSEDEKEVNEGILMLGESLLDTLAIPVQCNLFSNSDQESTSGEEDVLGKRKRDK